MTAREGVAIMEYGEAPALGQAEVIPVSVDGHVLSRFRTRPYLFNSPRHEPS